jgi:hypothetical protein
VGSEFGRPGSRAGTGQDALAQAVVEAAIRDPVPLPHGPGSGNGNGNGHGHANGNGNGNGRVPEPVSADR